MATNHNAKYLGWVAFQLMRHIGFVWKLHIYHVATGAVTWREELRLRCSYLINTSVGDGEYLAYLFTLMILGIFDFYSPQNNKLS
jgi:hypothetical protein